MNTSEMNRQKIFSTRFLVILLGISILTNIILITKLKKVNIIDKIQIALLPAPKVLPTDHVRGNANAKYTVIEYSDFQCHYCAQFHETMGAVMKEADVRWVYRHFPLDVNPLAAKAAAAAECAGEQGKFWEYSDALFARKGAIAEDTFTSVAQRLGLDWVSFGLCVASGRYDAAVAAQREDGVKKKITGTPTFYLNGKRYDGFVPLLEFRKLIGVNSGK